MRRVAGLKKLKATGRCGRGMLPHCINIPSNPSTSSKMASSKTQSAFGKPTLYAFAADGEVYPCQNPANTALCQALLDKSETYGHTGRDYYKRQNYIEAAETITVLGHSLAAVNLADSTEVANKISGYFGPHTAEFIIDFCKKNPPVAQGPSIAQIMHQGRPTTPPKIKCACADNQPVYEELMAHARSYPPEKKYNREAYLNAAAALAAHPLSLKTKPHTAWEIKGIGAATRQFIRNAADRHYSGSW